MDARTRAGQRPHGQAAGAVGAGAGERAGARHRAWLGICVAFAVVGCGGGGGGGVLEEIANALTVAAAPPPASAAPPAATALAASGYRSDQVLSLSSSSATMENELYFVGADGSFRSPVPADFRFTPTVWRHPSTGQTSTQTFSVQSVNCGGGTQIFAPGNFSGLMLFDRSGSMSSNDPGELSLDAGKVFAQAMTGSDEAAVAAFPRSTANNRPGDFSTYTGFTSDVQTVVRAVNSVGDPDGNTPLYDAVLSGLNFASVNGRRPNKAVLAFTDGENNSGTATEQNVIDRSRSLRVPVFPIGLTGGDNGALARIAKNTGGAFFYASEARQLAAVYKSLASILSGRGTTCKMTVKTDLTGTVHRFTQSTGSTWTFTRSVTIDGASVPFTFKQGFDVVH
jgi:hypothetical protein